MIKKLILLIIALVCCLWLMSTLKPKEPATMHLTIEDNQLFSLDNYDNKIIFLNFWASWCVPCLYEIPALMELQDAYSNDLQIIGITLDEEPQVVIDFQKKSNLNYPIYMYDEEIFKEFGPIQAVPTTLIFNKSKELIHIIPGYKEKPYFEQIIKQNI